MKTYEIWSEGYIVTGNSSGAILLGCAKGNSFETAVYNFVSTQRKDYRSYFRQTDGKWSCWGCRLFDNEADARKSFG